MPRTADAFVGESFVLNPAKTDLTGPAKSILTNPTFLTTEPAQAAAAGDVSTSLLAADGAAGLLPEMSVVLPWVGAASVAAIGSAVICETLFGGCLEFFGLGSDPKQQSPGTGYTWLKAASTFTLEGVEIPIGSAYTSEPLSFAQQWEEHACTGGEIPVPARPSSATKVAIGTSLGSQKCSGKEWTIKREIGIRQSAANRGVRVPVGGTKATTTFTPDSKWSEKMAACLTSGSGEACGLSHAEAQHLGQKVASEISGSGVEDPFSLTVTVPSCDGLLWGSCQGVLKEYNLEPVRKSRTWETAELTKPAGAVLELKPSKGTVIEKGSTVTVTTNPDESGMPLVVPLPEPAETYSHYVARLNPLLTPTRHDLDAAFVVPADGPNAVEAVSPAPETRLDPGTSHEVTVSTNPADVPAAGPPWSPPTVPPINMDPLSGFSPCGVFPFGLFCWVGEAFAQFNTTGTCPHFSTPVADTGSNFAVTLCGETAETIMGYLRPAILLAFTVGLGFLFARGTKAIGGD